MLPMIDVLIHSFHGHSKRRNSNILLPYSLSYHLSVLVVSPTTRGSPDLGKTKLPCVKKNYISVSDGAWTE